MNTAIVASSNGYFVYNSFDVDVNVTGSTFHMSEPCSKDSSADESTSSSSDDCDSDYEVDL